MKKSDSVPTSIDAYIAAFPKDIQKLLKQVHATIRKAAPDAEEKISYQMPTFKQGRNLIHFAAFKNHIGLYPGAAAIVKFKAKLKAYQTSKGAIQLPLDQPIPLKLIEDITTYRVKEELKRLKTKK